MERQKRNNFSQTVQRQIHVPERSQRVSAVPSREALVKSVNQQHTVVQQTVSQVQDLAAMPLGTQKQPQNPHTKKAEPHVTFEQIAGTNTTQMPNNSQPVAHYGNAVAATMTMPAQNLVAGSAQLAQKVSNAKNGVLNRTGIKQSIDKVKSVADKIKNSRLADKARSTITPNSKIRHTDILRYGVVAICLFVAGFLAFDTWQTNRQIQEVITPTASATTEASVAGEEVAPAASATNSYTVAPDMPRVLTIPSIGVNANVVSVGVIGGNQVDMPASFLEAGWFNGSDKPGTGGSAFIAGHYNIGSAGVFNNLANMNIDDNVQIELGNGEKVNYKVYNKETIAADAVDMATLISNNGRGSEVLNLMTCSGTYDGYRFSHRVIVYTERV